LGASFFQAVLNPLTVEEAHAGMSAAIANAGAGPINMVSAAAPVGSVLGAFGLRPHGQLLFVVAAKRSIRVS